MSVLRVASFNIRNGLAFDWRHCWWLRRRATLAAILELNADVVGLQEAYRFQLRWLTARLGDMTVVGDGRSHRRRGEHTALLVRSTAATVITTTTQWFGASSDRPGTRLAGARLPRIATTAELLLVDGATLSVTSTHLDERSNERRLESVKQLMTWLPHDASAQVVLGDLNATPDSPVVGQFVENGFTRADTGPSGTVHQFSGRTDGRILDHILVRGPVTVAAAGVSHARPGGALPSDHWPVWADLEVAE